VNDELYRDHARHLWSLCYRMTGSASDAEDLVQETFTRALTSPPARTDEPWRPWLVRVAVNLARDRLRRRKRSPYVGEWLPSPVETGDAASDDDDPERRYGLLESASYAFLLACEALTPRQRAVLLLRDVLDYTVEETAGALELTSANVKTTHHRARAAMAAYDTARRPPTRALQGKTRIALEQLAFALSTGDAAQVEALLAPGAVTINDGGGEYRAALRPVVGASKVARFYVGLLKKTVPVGFAMRMVNGLPAFLIETSSTVDRVAPRVLVRCDLDDDGRIVALHAVLATAKLTALAA
jgi:RNA polymerase sigma-70 factor (ECF subfamily)